MSNAAWSSMSDMFLELVELAPGERERRLAALEPGLRAQVGALLAAHFAADGFLETPPVRFANIELSPGDEVGDFTILEEIGRGAFAIVYRARQISLGREVALKVSADRGTEARTMASLQHDHVVPVYSETVDAARALRCICMPLLRGGSLEALLRERAPATDRALRIASQIASALAHAHDTGLLHLDIKPANILLDAEGDARLGDFNVSYSAGGEPSDRGGTLAYMSPEQAAAFEGGDRRAWAALGARSDVYSLGKVFGELFAAPHADAPEIDRLIAACLDPQSERRPASAEVVRALDNCQALARRRQALPPDSVFTAWAAQRPLLALTVGGGIIQLMASLVGIAYNEAQIVSRLDPEQQRGFQQLLLVYNPIAFGVGVALWLRALEPFLGGAARLAAGELRNRALGLRRWVAGLAWGSWLPGALFFPLALHAKWGPLGLPAMGHFVLSFTLTCLIATSYGVLYADYLVLRGWYLRFWDPREEVAAVSRRELAPFPRELARYQFAIGAIPLVAAGILTWLGPAPGRDSGLRLLVSSLIGLGVGGQAFALRASRRLQQTLSALLLP